MTFDDHTRSACDHVENARAFRLGSEVAILIWDIPAGRPAPAKHTPDKHTPVKHTLVMSEQPVPLVSMVVPLAHGGQRILWAMRPGNAPDEIRISDEAGNLETATLRPARELPPLDVETLFADLAPEAQVKFLNNLL
ncbi:MAG TPA: glycosyltransferase family 2 protein, partial [Sinorhizobium sp.]|nr:glycosyltransferase family 2 protein [Sinorhizobium sp.]